LKILSSRFPVFKLIPEQTIAKKSIRSIAIFLLMKKSIETDQYKFDVFLFYHWERCEKVGDRGLKECVANRFSPRPYFSGLFRALQAHCSVASNS